MQLWKNRWARVAGRRVFFVSPHAGRCRARTWGLAAALLIAWGSLGAADTAWAGQGGGLTFQGCVATSSAAVGCVNVPGGTDTDQLGVAVSPGGHSVYVAAGDRVEHFFVAPNGALSYDGCVSNDGSGGTCADIPGNATPLTGAVAVAVSPDGRSVYVASNGRSRILTMRPCRTSSRPLRASSAGMAVSAMAVSAALAPPSRASRCWGSKASR